MIILIDPSKHSDPKELPSEKRKREMGLPDGILYPRQCRRCGKHFMGRGAEEIVCPPCLETMNAMIDAFEAAETRTGNLPECMDRIVKMEKPVTHVEKRAPVSGELVREAKENWGN